MREYTLTIEAGKSTSRYFKDLWVYRELFLFLAWRDILVRYKQTVIGVTWAIIRPLLTMLIFAFIFGRVAKLPSDGVPYTLMVFCAMIPWTFFSATVTDGSNSLVGNERLISKVYFPRLIVPTTCMFVSSCDALISACLLPLLMIYYNIMPHIQVLLIPILTLPAILAGLGISYGMSALNVKYRDFRHAVPFMVQLGMYISPVAYTTSLIPEKWLWLYSINPMVGVIDAWRWALLGTNINWLFYGVSTLTATMCFIVGIAVFRSMEKEFADVI